MIIDFEIYISRIISYSLFTNHLILQPFFRDIWCAVLLFWKHPDICIRIHIYITIYDGNVDDIYKLGLFMPVIHFNPSKTEWDLTNGPLRKLRSSY